MNAVYGLIWEQWRQSRWVLGSSLLLLGLYLNSLAFAQWSASRFDVEEAALAAWIIPVFAMILIVPRHGLKALRMSLPARLLVLPVSPATLVTVQLGSLCGMGLVLSLLTIAGLGLVVPFTGIEAFPALLVVLGAAWGYFLMCCMTAHELPGALLRFALALASTYYVVLRLPLWLEPGPFQGSASLWLAVFAVGSLCVPWALSVVMVRRAKRGEKPGRALQAIRLPRFLASAHAPRYLRFLEEPRFQCMVWYEWRQTLVLLPALTAVALALTLLASTQERGFVAAGILVTLPLAFGTGFYALRANEWYRGFQFVRPLSTGRMAGAKLAAASLATLLSGSMVAGSLFVFLVLDAVLFGREELFAFSAPGLWYWLGVLLATWVTLVIGRVLLVTAGVVYAVLIPYAVLHEGISDEAVLGVCALVIALGLSVGSLYALYRRLLSVRALCWGGALAGVLCLLVLSSVEIVTRAGGIPLPVTHFGAMLAIGLGLLPLLYLPILLHYQRHG